MGTRDNHNLIHIPYIEIAFNQPVRHAKRIPCVVMHHRYEKRCLLITAAFRISGRDGGEEEAR